MTEIVLFFLFVSVLFYLLFGGADFGAGILELFSRKKNQAQTADITYRVIGPVWEANHIWLIIVIVILWTGFPKIYSTISTYLHIPLLLMLIGIIARGTTFIFRHYDAIKDKSHDLYNKIFKISSFITPFFIGVISGAMISGQIDPEPADFFTGYIKPWFNGFAFSMGLFVVSISAFLAAVYLISEAETSYHQQRFIVKTKVTSITTLISGFLVFITAYSYSIPLVEHFIGHGLSIAAVILATLSIPLFWFYLKKGKYILIRAIGALQVSLITGAWFAAQFPVFIFLSDGSSLDLQNTIAPESTITLLAMALVVAGAIILPGLYHLMRSFDMIKLISRKKN